MNQLKRHIEILLLDNDCVIVPDFGGFVAHHVSARYDEADNTFLPPMRTLGFNPQLRMNDSLLVQSYIEAYDISYPEALRRVERDTEELRQQIQEDGYCTLDDLGTLSVNMEGHYEFEPFKSGLLSPDIYGLVGVPFKQQEVLEEDTEITASQDSEQIVQPATQEVAATPALLDFMADDDETAVSVKMSWIRNAVAIAAAIVAFFLFSTPVVNSELGSQTMSRIQGNLLQKLIPQDTNIATATPVSNVDSQTIENQEPTNVQPASTQTTAIQSLTEQPKASYCIVVASQVRKSNAEAFAEQLHQQGYPEAEVYIHNNIVRVTCGNFATQAEAYRRLNSLSGKPVFADAWVYKKTVE